MKIAAHCTDHPRVPPRRSRAGLVAAVVIALIAVSACSSRVQGAVAGNTRLNTATTQASLPLDSSEVLTPQSSPARSGDAAPGTEDTAPSPDADQTTALRSRLRSIDAGFDTDDAVARSTAVCEEILGGADSLTIAATVRAQFGADLSAGTVTAVQNVVTNTFCQR